MNTTPPRLATYLLHLLIPAHRTDELEGDLDELFQQRVRQFGVRKARWRYVKDVASLMRPSLMQRQPNTLPAWTYPQPTNTTMIRNYFKIAWRTIARSKGFSGINIAGLSLGMTCSLLILLWVQDERSVDGFHANGKNLYQVYERNYFDGKTEAAYETQGLLADELKRAIPEIQYASGLEWNQPFTFQVGNKIGKMDGSFAGADFFKMFSYPLLEGSAETALNAPNGIAISRKMADQFFGSPAKAIGKVIRYENNDNLTVTAVFENLPANSSQQFDFLRTWTDFVKTNDWVNNWGNVNPFTYIQLRSSPNGEPADPANVEAKIKEFTYRYKPKNKAFIEELALQPYPEKYLHSTFKNGQLDGGRIEYVRLFSFVAIFILLIACINFMNLATARSAKRAKEVGVRKAIGAARSALMGQFVGEAILLTSIAMLFAIGLVALTLPAFNNLTGKQLLLPFSQPIFWATLLSLLLLTGFLSGSYPALFLSALNPVKVLKGSLRFSPGATNFRKALVVFQFGLSILLIVGMIVMYRQVDYIQTKNIGFNRENLIYMPLEGELGRKYTLFKEEASNMPGIQTISRMRGTPTLIEHHTGDFTWSGKDPNQAVKFADETVGYDFVKTMGLTMVEGRDFSRAFGTDSVGFLVNEAALAKIGYKTGVDQPLTWGSRQGKIIGVLKDFHFSSMHQAIEPIILRLDETRIWGTVIIRAEAGKTKEALASLEKVSHELNPNFPFSYQFSDLEFSKLYRSEHMVSQLANYFAILTIFISCLGLFGLATFAAEQRTKEIGVRKVLGASAASVVALLAKDFLKPVMIAIVLTTPIAWYAMNRWLQDFAYKIAIDWWVFALAGGLSIGIALLTISFQSIKAALLNPVASLRSE
ncbi:ABC transporter permease [Spirosoma litoris]